MSTEVNGETQVDSSVTVVGPVAVTGPLTDAELRAAPVPVSTGGLTDAELRAAPVPIVGVVVTGGLTDAELRALPVPISAGALPLPVGAATAALQTQPGVDIGDVTVNNAGGAAAVNVQDGGNSLTVDGPLTDAELRALPVPISAGALPLPVGAATAALQTQPGVDIGDVTVNNAAGAGAVNIQDGGNSITVDGPLTDAQLRATPVPVSGTVTTLAGGTETFANGVQTTAGAAAAECLAANANRKSAIIQNVGTVNVRVGKAGVTATTGLLLLPDGVGVLNLGGPNVDQGAWFCIRDAGSDGTVFAMEST